MGQPPCQPQARPSCSADEEAGVNITPRINDRSQQATLTSGVWVTPEVGTDVAMGLMRNLQFKALTVGSPAHWPTATCTGDDAGTDALQNRGSHAGFEGTEAMHHDPGTTGLMCTLLPQVRG